MSETYDYDYFVIGAGSGGVRSARIAATHGAKTGIAEKAHLGGTCVNIGCVPKKLFAYGADFGPSFEDARGYGWRADNVSFDWQTLRGNKDTEIARLNGIYKNILDNAGVDLIDGHACLLDPHTVQIGDQKITADKILIATGATPRRPTVPGGDLFKISDDMFYLDELPQKAVIVGGGYIAVEFAHILHGIGVEVDLLYRGSMFLRSFDDDLSLTLADEMRKSGINLHFHCDIESAGEKDDKILVHCTTGGTIECDLALAAIGRIPNADNLGLDAAGIDLCPEGTIEVNKHHQTSTPNIYAIGDVTNTPNLTPVALREGHWLADHLFGSHNPQPIDYTCIPTAIFSHPPIGTVGLSEEQAKVKDYDFDVYKTTFKPMVHTLSGRDEKTMMKLIVDKKTDKVIGLHMIGRDTPEMLQGFAVAMNAGATKADFDRTIAIHPTAAEELVTMRTPVIPEE